MASLIGRLCSHLNSWFWAIFLMMSSTVSNLRLPYVIKSDNDLVDYFILKHLNDYNVGSSGTPPKFVLHIATLVLVFIYNLIIYPHLSFMTCLLSHIPFINLEMYLIWEHNAVNVNVQQRSHVLSWWRSYAIAAFNFARNFLIEITSTRLSSWK